MFTLLNTVLLIVLIVLLSKKKFYVHLEDDHKTFDKNYNKNRGNR